MQAVAVVGGVALLIALVTVVSHNRFVEQQQLIDNSWSNVDTELRRRYDLIPNLVRTVQGYAAHEQDTLESVVQARNRAVATDGDVADQSGAEDALMRSLRSLLAVSEAYPDLKADTQFLALQRELVATEDRIQAARRIFNANVRDLNQRVQTIPSTLVAHLFGFQRRPYFELDPVLREADPPTVPPS